MQSGPFEGTEGVGETEPLVAVSRHENGEREEEGRWRERRIIRHSSTA